MTTSNDESEHADVAGDLRKVLNSHGHGFQYAVLRRAEELASTARSKWVFEGVEFPVVAGDQTTHIDFILRSRSRRTILVAECKRVDPARGRWSFVQAPYTWRNPSAGALIFDQFLCSPINLVTERLCTYHTSRDIYHLGLELKTGAKGDGISGGISAINSAVAQVLRGTSGLINYLCDNSRISVSEDRLFRFIPVIFTTAEIWTTKANLGTAELASGNLPKASVQVEQADWIWFTHNRSPAIRHNMEWDAAHFDLAEALRSDFARSVAIVSPVGVDQFLATDLESLLE